MAATYPYPYYAGYPYYGAYPYYAAPPATVYQQRPADATPSEPLVQREVVYPHGKYVLHGDGVTQAWQWVWVQAANP